MKNTIATIFLLLIFLILSGCGSDNPTVIGVKPVEGEMLASLEFRVFDRKSDAITYYEKNGINYYLLVQTGLKRERDWFNDLKVETVDGAKVIGFIVNSQETASQQGIKFLKEHSIKGSLCVGSGIGNTGSDKPAPVCKLVNDTTKLSEPAKQEPAKQVQPKQEQPKQEQPKQEQPKQEQPKQEPLDQSTKSTTYTNSRYGFTIKYPSKWAAGEESDNGDGKALYIGNPDVDIRVYAHLYLKGISDPYYSKDKTMSMQKTKLDNGSEAFLVTGKVDNKVLYDMVFISKNEIEYHFYAKVSEKFFQTNEATLLKVAKSLSP